MAMARVQKCPSKNHKFEFKVLNHIYSINYSKKRAGRLIRNKKL